MNTKEELSFNDLPQAMSLVLDKVTSLENTVSGLREDLRKSRSAPVNEHQPMGVEETCEFLKMKKTTLYYYAQNNLIPVTKKGKRYLFFKDELISWIESGRKEDVPLSLDEINEQLGRYSKRTRPIK